MRRRRKVELLPQLVESIVGETADVFILFVDLCGSTEYKFNCISLKQPDSTWIIRQLIFLQRAAEIIKKHNGTVAKTIGDSILAFFVAATEPEDVLKCAIEIIQGFGNLKAYKGPSKIEVKASIDFGLTYNGSIVDNVPFDPIGLPVDRCARLNSQAKKDEILLSDDFFVLARGKSSMRDFKAKYGCEEQEQVLKGIGQTKYFRMTAK
jgi:class 3 adenylate cyclase